MAIDFDNETFDLPKVQEGLIKVIGVGGGGGNAANYMYKQNIEGVDYIICNTDRQVLDKSPILHKIHLGPTLTGGLGAGSNPEVGEQSAMESIDEIKAIIGEHTEMVFITAGMGGGTGTGAAPIIAKVCHDMGILTVGIVTSPFKFEGEIRLAQAQKGIENLRKHLDSLIVINNNNLRDVYGNLGVKTSFAKADEVLTIAAKGIAEVITKEFEMNIDLRDARTVLSNSGTAIMGTGTGEGENRALEAVQGALYSPLLNDNKIIGAKNVLLSIRYGKDEITMDEVAQINEYIQREANNGRTTAEDFKTNIIMGVGQEEALGDKVMVTVIATGFSTEQQHEIMDMEPQKIIHSLDDDAQFVKELDTTSTFTNTSFENSMKLKGKNTTFIVEEAIEGSPKATLEMQTETSKSHMGITLHSPGDKKETKAVKYAFDKEVYKMPVHFEIVERIALPEQEEFIIYQEKKTAPIAQQPKRQEPVRELVPAQEPVLAGAVAEMAPLKGVQHEDKIVYNLEDYAEVEQHLIQAQASQVEEDPFATEMQLKQLPTQPSAPTRQEENPNPLIGALLAGADHRKKVFKTASHQFSSQNISKIDELENTPAYLRQNVDISTASTAVLPSRSTLSLDSNNTPQIRENNAYLHDRVD